MYDDFDVYVADYRQVHSKNVSMTGADSSYFAKHKVRCLQQYEINKELNWLDLGCGDGMLTMFLEEAYPLGNITAADVSAESIALAKEKKLRAKCIHYDGAVLPCSSDSFDVVILAAVLHHIRFEQHADFLKEVFRVLKPGGRVYVFEHNPYHPATRYMVRTCIFDKDARLLKPAYTRQIFLQSGFVRPSIRYTLFFPRWFGYRIWEKLEQFIGQLPFGGQYLFRAEKDLRG